MYVVAELTTLITLYFWVLCCFFEDLTCSTFTALCRYPPAAPVLLALSLAVRTGLDMLPLLVTMAQLGRQPVADPGALEEAAASSLLHVAVGGMDGDHTLGLGAWQGGF